MKISLNWLKDYIDIPLSPQELAEVLTSTGLEVEGEEVVEAVKGGLEGVVVGKVETCRKHPNADKLSLTEVSVGNGALLQIVCGAPNVAAGQKVLVATIGTTLYSPEGEAWTIKKGKIRGETSEGMICAEDELGLGTNHNGIMVLDEKVEVGISAKEYLNLPSDYVYEIGLTPNRSDATNHIGVARDVVAALRVHHGQKEGVRLPNVDQFKIDNNSLPVEVIVEDSEACPRYSGVSIKGVTIKESPDWLKRRLEAIGVRPINNVVDITNYVLHEFGQPLHAFDLNQIKGQKIIVKTLPEGSIFRSLDEIDRKLFAEDLMICDGASNGMCIGGVFGGISSGVTDSTVNLFLESAHFNAKSIRRSSMKHNLRTDAAKVFEKGSDPNVTIHALKRASLLITELAGGEIASEVVDIYPNPIAPVEVEVSYDQVNSLIGLNLSPDKIKEILAALEMALVTESETTFTVAIPTNKADVTRPADVIEEILRIYGFNNVPTPSKLRTAMAIGKQPDPNVVRNVVGDLLASNGFYEMMAVSLSESRYYRDIISSVQEQELVYINNTSNIHLDIMRPEMLMSGLEAVLYNQNRQQTQLRLFEYGYTYRKGEKGYDEVGHLTLFMTGKRWQENWLTNEKDLTSFYTLKAYVQNILTRLGIEKYQESEYNDEVFSYGLHYHRGPQTVVKFGKVSGKILKKMDVRMDVFYADFHWDAIMKALRKHKITVEDLNKYPSTRRDLAIVVENSVKFSDIASIAAKVGKKLLKSINLFDVYVNEKQLGANKKSYAVSFTFENPEKTLKDKEVDKIMNQLIQAYETQLDAVIRR
ncbi:MAG: phenylalanine--tRNA ligase beta subunit [Saprospiraceae bacterium]|nr:MAG: phenylalanine--tRNA ligase beta subunit [Saprospiraceae bacterium]